MDGIWKSGGIAPPFLTSALDGGEWSASRPLRVALRDIAPVVRCIGDWIGPRARLDAVGTGKNCCSAGNQIPVVQPIA
jgi:hypothetical protein